MKDLFDLPASSALPVPGAGAAEPSPVLAAQRETERAGDPAGRFVRSEKDFRDLWHSKMRLRARAAMRQP